MEGHGSSMDSCCTDRLGTQKRAPGKIRPCVWAPRAQSRAKRIQDRAERPPGAQQFTPAMGAGRVRVGRGRSPRGRGTGAGSSEGEGAGAPAHWSAKGSPRPPGRLHSQHRMSTQSLSVRSSQSPGCRKTWHAVYQWPAGFCLFPPTAFYRRQHKSLSQLP